MFEITSRDSDSTAEVRMISNGYFLSLRGRNKEDSWISREVYAKDFESMTYFLSEFFNLPIHD